MKIAVVADHHYYADGKGNVYVPTVYGYDYWCRYLSVFDEITVICRCNENAPFDGTKMLKASGAGVNFAFIPDFSGMKEMVLTYFSSRKKLEKYLADCDFTFVRVPSPLSRQAVNYLMRHKKMFACEVAADPAESYDNVPFSRIIKRTMKRHCEKACLGANGVTYVTRDALQKKYPSKARQYGNNETQFETYYSNANLSEMFYQYSRSYAKKPDRLELIHVANNIAGNEKGHYVCLDIVKKLKQKQVPVNLTFIGDGPEVPSLKAHAVAEDLNENVQFAGRLADPIALRNAYLQADVLLLPSKTEGLPRCVLEAMACGVVCLASDAGGIPEVLQPEDIFSWQNADGFAERIVQMWNEWHQMEAKGTQNRQLAKQYSAEELKKRRDDFYTKAKQLCEEGVQL